MPVYLRVNGARLWSSLMEMAKIGATPNGGVCRIAFSDEDGRARDLFVDWCAESSCRVSIDRFGNIFARRPGRRDDLAVVMAGSHLDSRPSGGKFDGVYGVLAGLEVIRTLNDRGIETEAPIEVAVWTNEEGCIFTPMLGSAVFTGMVALGDALAMRESAGGWTLEEGLRRIGYVGEVPVNSYPVRCYFEAHIEQGPVLEDNGNVIGVVTSAQGQRWYDISLEGVDAHAGPTPMSGRKDALVGAARIVLEINRLGCVTPCARGTVGRMLVLPNSSNVVPGRVEFSGDLRHPDADVLVGMDRTFRERAQTVADELGLGLDIQQRTYIEPVPFHPELVGLVRNLAEREGRPYQDIYTGAGHDAVNIAKTLPAAMIFVPCEGGISHNEAESAKPEDLTSGCNVLANAMLAAASGALVLGSPEAQTP